MNRRAEARDPATPPARLHELSKAGCAREVAANPNTPTALLLKLAARHFDAFLANPVLPLLILEDPGFCQKIPASALRRLLRREKLPEHFLESLTRHPDREVSESARLHIARAAPGAADALPGVLTSLSAAPAGGDHLLTLLRLDLMPLWMSEAFAGAASIRLRAAVIESFRHNPAPGAPELWSLYKEAGLLPVGPDRYQSMLSPYLQPGGLARLARGGPAARRAAATHPQTPPEELKRLCRDSVRAVHLAALRNRSTPPEALWNRAGHTNERYRLAVLANPCAPELLIEQLAADPSPRVRAAALRHRLVNPAALDRLAADPDPKVRRAAARHRCTGPATLAKLARDPDPGIQEIVARRPALPPEEVDHLLAHGGADVRQAIARRADLTEEQMVRVYCDPDRMMRVWAGNRLGHQQSWRLQNLASVPEEVRTGLREVGYTPAARKPWQQPPPRPLPPWRPQCRRWRQITNREDWALIHAGMDKNLPRSVYEQLAAHPLARVRESVANNYMVPPDILHRLATDPDPKVRERLSFNTSILPETAAILARDPLGRVRRFTAYNRNTPPSVLTQLADDPDPQVRTSVIGNANTPEDIVRRLAADSESAVREHLRHNRNAPGDLLAILYENSTTAPQEVLIQHRNIPRALLEAALHSSSLTLCQAAAANPALTGADLAALAARSETGLRVAVAKHPALTPQLAADLANSSEPAILEALAANTSAPPEVLAMLAAHPHPGLKQPLLYNESLPAGALMDMLRRATDVEEFKLFAHRKSLPEEAVRLLASRLPEGCSGWFGLMGNPSLTPALAEELYQNAGGQTRTMIAFSSKDNPVLQTTLIRLADSAARVAFASSKTLMPEAMLLLAADAHWQVRMNLAQHPFVTEEARQILFANSAGENGCECAVRSSIAFHRDTSSALRIAILLAELPRGQAELRRRSWRIAYTAPPESEVAWNSAGLLYGLLRRHDVPVEHFAPLLDKPPPEFVLAFLDRPDLPAEWRQRLRRHAIHTALKASALPQRLCALTAADCPPAAMHKAAATGRWLERYALTQNPAVSQEMLALLATDSNTLVRAAARSGPTATAAT